MRNNVSWVSVQCSSGWMNEVSVVAKLLNSGRTPTRFVKYLNSMFIFRGFQSNFKRVWIGLFSVNWIDFVGFGRWRFKIRQKCNDFDSPTLTLFWYYLILTFFIETCMKCKLNLCLLTELILFDFDCNFSCGGASKSGKNATISPTLTLF